MQCLIYSKSENVFHFTLWKILSRSIMAINIGLLFLFCLLSFLPKCKYCSFVHLCLIKPNLSAFNSLSTIFSIRFTIIRMRIFDACEAKIILYTVHKFLLLSFSVLTLLCILWNLGVFFQFRNFYRLIQKHILNIFSMFLINLLVFCQSLVIFSPIIHLVISQIFPSLLFVHCLLNVIDLLPP